MSELQDWFTGADEGQPVFYAPEGQGGYDPLWVRLGDGVEIGRGLRSFTLTNSDLHWLRELLNRHAPLSSASREPPQ